MAITATHAHRPALAACSARSQSTPGCRRAASRRRSPAPLPASPGEWLLVAGALAVLGAVFRQHPVGRGVHGRAADKSRAPSAAKPPRANASSMSSNDERRDQHAAAERHHRGRSRPCARSGSSRWPPRPAGRTRPATPRVPLVAISGWRVPQFCSAILPGVRAGPLLGIRRGGPWPCAGTAWPLARPCPAACSQRAAAPPGRSQVPIQRSTARHSGARALISPNMVSVLLPWRSVAGAAARSPCRAAAPRTSPPPGAASAEIVSAGFDEALRGQHATVAITSLHVPTPDTTGPPPICGVKPMRQVPTRCA